MEKIITTVSNIFKERYGAQLKIERRTRGAQRQPYFLSHWPNSFVYSRTLQQVSFPIFNPKRELQAIATASPVQNQDAIIFDEMAQFLQLTIAEHLGLVEVAEDQAHTEMAMQKAHADTTKVVDLKTRTQEKASYYEYKKPQIKRNADPHPIWISGDNLGFNAHIAFSIHDWIANWAFINSMEIPDLVWQDPNCWRNFPQVTIFIPDVSQLLKDQILRLKQNIQQVKRMDGEKPLIVVTSSSQVSEELEELKGYFKHYRANNKVTARVQAHFLLFHHQEEKRWAHNCRETESLYFLPFSPGPTNLH